MPDRSPDTGKMLALSADYSDDELDALAELFDRPRLRQRRSEADREERVRRAVADAALRGLVARRALVLEGDARRPRVRLLEPHAGLLDPFINATATVAVRVERPGHVLVRALFFQEESLVVQDALPGQAIKRMTLSPVASASAFARAGLPLPTGPGPEGRRGFELTPRMLENAERALDTGEPAADCVPALALDLLHARSASATVRITRSEPGGTIVFERRSWFDAGTLGVWEIVPGESDPPATLRFEPQQGPVLAEWLAQSVALIVP